MDNLENKKTQTPLKDNSDNGADTNQNEDLTKERWKQQLEWSKKEADKYRQYALETEVSKAKTDANSLLELHDKDPKLANEVAKRFWYESFDDARKTIDQSKVNSNEFTEERFEEMYQRRRQREEHDLATKKAEEVLNRLEWEAKEKAQSYFNRISEGKTLDTNTALEFAEMATLYVSRDKLKSDKFSDSLAKLWSNSISNSKKDTWSQWGDYIVKNWRLILKSNK